MNRYELTELLKGTWAIDQKFAMLHFGHVANFLEGKFIYEQVPESSASKPFAQNSNNKYSAYDEAPKGSVAIIPLNGVMTKYSQTCGPVGTSIISQRILEASRHKNIGAVIIQIDSGGGSVNSINPLVEAIESAKKSKPVIAFVDDVMASAALMSGSHADLIIASHEMAEIGSLGVMAHFADYTPVAKKEGVIFHKIYADQSSDKNKAYDKALEGDYTLLKEKELNPLAQSAIENLKKLRGDKITDNSVYSANMFFAKDAVKIGLIDEIGNLEYAVRRASELANIKNPKSNSRNINSNHNKAMDKKTIPALMFVLGLDMLESNDDKFNLSADQVKELQTHFAENYGKTLMFTGGTFNDDGSADFTKKGLLNLNAIFTEAMATKNIDARKAGQSAIDELKKANATKVAELEEKIKKLGEEPENMDLPGKPGGEISDFRKNATGINAIGAERPWNEAAIAKAEGDKAKLNFLLAQDWTDKYTDTLVSDIEKFADTGIDIGDMNDVLGAYYREVDPNITDMMVEGESITKIFPMRSTGTQDIYAHITSYITEHLQPRNSGKWAEKGSNQFAAEEVRLKPWEVTRTFKREEMQQFMTSWLATKTKGTDPYQSPFVMWFVAYIKRHIALVERPKNAILGVYATPEKDVPGASINSMDGALKTLQNLIAENRILVFKVGKGEYLDVNSSGDLNRNHVYYKIDDMIQRMPKLLRDGEKWNVLMSKEDYRQRNIFIKNNLASDANFQKQEAAINRNNFSYTPVPYMPDGLYIITLHKNGTQLFRDKSDDNRIYIERSKRNTDIHMDGAYGFIFHLTGKKFDTHQELIDSKGEYQRIFTNGEFGAYTSIPMDVDDATPSVAVHNVLMTAENTGTTTITSFDDAIVGQTIYVIGGSSVNPSRILASNTKFIGVDYNIIFNENVIAGFEVMEGGKFTLIELYDQNNHSAIQFDADDATPSVADGYLFITSNQNTSGNEEITDFEDAQVGKTFKVIGGGGTNPSKINKAGKFANISANWTGTDGEEIILKKRTFGDFVEVNE